MSTPPYTQAGAAFGALILEVFRLNGRLLTAGDRLMGPLGLTSARWQVLGAIALSPTREPVARLARTMGLTRQGVQRIVGDLVTDGLVELTDNPHHRRARLVSLTAKGQSIYESTFAVQGPWVNAVAEGLSERGIEAAMATLHSLRLRLEDHQAFGGGEDL